MFGNRDVYSPVQQDFVWIAEYLDGTYLSEYSYETKKPNPLYAVNRDNLLRFGLIGNGANLYFEVYGGIFKILGQMIELEYINGDKTYHLTNRPMMYKNIDTHKNVDMVFAPDSDTPAQTRITQYSFGYSVIMDFDGIEMLVEINCLIPTGQHALIDVRLVPSQDLNGHMRIRRNGREVGVVEAPAAKGAGGHVTWTLI